MRAVTFRFGPILIIAVMIIAVVASAGLTADGQQKAPANAAPGKVLGDILSKPAEVKAAVDAASKKTIPDESIDKSPSSTPESVPGDKKVPPVTAPPLLSFPKRDPFRPYTVTSRASARRRENLSPLEKYELGQLKLVAVIWNTKEPTAMVEDAAGLGYLVKVGTPIGPNDGKVKTIKRDGIVIEESTTDLYGVTKKQESTMRLSAESAG
ncbi:MAG TPA: pilus assembly protein PilP [Candidatus Binatia bacterium]|jgi:Tfp pilus assembly protein PilP